MFAFNLGGQELALIGLAVLLLFGAKRVPEVFRALGQGIAEFKRASREVFRELQEDQPAGPQQVQSHQGVIPPKASAEETAQSSQSVDEAKKEQ